nr:nitric oxide-associated protein 1-like [Crassostrea gigas]
MKAKSRNYIGKLVLTVKMFTTRRFLLPCDICRSLQKTHRLIVSSSLNHASSSYKQKNRRKTRVKQHDTFKFSSVNPAIVELGNNQYLLNKPGNTGTFNVDFLSEINEKIKEITKDVDFNINRKPRTFEKDQNKSDDSSISSKPKVNYGTPDKSIAISEVPCGGCGALLHCQDHTVPGYIPSEVFKEMTKEELRDSKCQKCHKMQYHKTLIDIRATDDRAHEIMKEIQENRRCMVMLIVDLLDIENSIPDLFHELIPSRKPIFVIGNKVDIIPQDHPDYLDSVHQTLVDACINCGLEQHNVKHVTLISAKTGFGVETLISKLLQDWGMSGDVYMIGTANSGKSTLYNSLLNSDYCNHHVRDIVPQATVSELPGTTMNTLKFPIMNAKTNWLMKMRQDRLRLTKAKEMVKRIKVIEETKKSKKLMASSILTTLREKVEKTDFAEDEDRRTQYSGFDLTAYDYRQDKVLTNDGKEFIAEKQATYDEQQFKNSRFLYDTPGLLCDSQIYMDLLPEELKLISPAKKIVPHCILLKQDYTVFVTGLGRLDYVEGNQDVMLVIYISSKLPVHIVPRPEAEEFYSCNIGTEVLGLPLGDESRLAKLPPLKGRNIRIRPEDQTYNTAAADIQLSSLGWVSVVGMSRSAELDVTLRVYTPGACGIYIRPAMLKNAHVFHLKRVKNTLKYKRNKPKLLLMKGEQF